MQKSEERAELELPVRPVLAKVHPAGMRSRIGSFALYWKKRPVVASHYEMSDRLLMDIGILPDQVDKRFALERHYR